MKFSGGHSSATKALYFPLDKQPPLEAAGGTCKKKKKTKQKNKGYAEHRALSLPTSPQHLSLSLLFTRSPLHTIATITLPTYTLKRLLPTNIPHTGAQKQATIPILVIRPHHEVLIGNFTTWWVYYTRLSQINTSQRFSVMSQPCFWLQAVQQHWDGTKPCG